VHKSRSLALLALAVMGTFAVPMLCLTLSASVPAEINSPAAGGCHGHHAPLPHIPQPKHLCCSIGHQVPTTAQSVTIVGFSSVVGSVDAVQLAAARSREVDTRPAVKASPPPSAVLRI
jgi:hypothetical protein